MNHKSLEQQKPKQKLNVSQIVAKSSPLFERLQGNFIPETSPNNEEIIKKNLESWCQKIAQGDWKRFRKRWEWDGLNLEYVRQFLGEVRLKNSQKLPDWAILIDEVISRLPDFSKSQIEEGLGRCKGNKRKYPFEEILYPFVQVSREKLIETAGSNSEILTPQAIACLEVNLLQELSSLASNALYLEFSLFRSRQTSSLQRLLQELKSESEAQVYEMFVGKMLAGDLSSFLEEYAVLSRLIGTAIALWIEANAEFLNRLSLDLPAIKITFFKKKETGKIVDLKLSLSDAHNGHRTAIILSFQSGKNLVYKPKNLGLDRAYFDLLEWFNQQNFLLPFKTLKLLERRGYGWMEYADNLPCPDEDAARRFYQRAGILLGLTYSLEAVDCFYENIIACGEYPLLIDLETLMHNNFKLERHYSESYDIRPIDIIWWNSVFRIGLLPTIRLGSDMKMSYDVGGLREAGEQVLPFLNSAWRSVNSDQMKREQEFMKVEVKSSVPRIGETHLCASDYTDDIVFGFQKMYRFIVNRKDELTGKNSPIENFKRCRSRYILRNTKFYTSLLRSLLEPVYLRDGIKRSIEIDIVSRMSLDTGEKAVYWPLIEWETRALEQMDIPFFTLLTDEIAIELPDGKKVDNFCEKSGLENVISKINSLSDRDLQTQSRLSESILRLSAISGGHGTAEQVKIEPEIDGEAILSPSELIAEAKAIADELKTLAIYTDDGGATWIAPQLQADRYILQPLRLDLYQGVAGLLLFLAALERVAGDGEYRQLIRAAADPLKDAIATTPPSTLAKNGYSIGGYTGLGSLVYTFTRMGEFLSEPTWLENANFIASLISPDAIATDQNLDVLGGSAGAILSLLTLYQKNKNSQLLETAVCCGEHLLASRIDNERGFKGWHKIGTDFMTGFAHGAAGIAYALLRLSEVSGEDRFQDAARDAITYEQSVFDEIAGNWPDFREAMQPDSPTQFMTAWCNGAPGIGLARMGGLSVFNTPQIEQEIDRAIHTTRQFTRRGKDHLCCGNFGRIEMLLVAAQNFSRADLFPVANRQASWVVRRSHRRGSYHLFDQFLPGIFHPAFFQGTSGIGYQLLRLAEPDLLPSVLLLA